MTKETRTQGLAYRINLLTSSKTHPSLHIITVTCSDKPHMATHTFLIIIKITTRIIMPCLTLHHKHKHETAPECDSLLICRNGTAVDGGREQTNPSWTEVASKPPRRPRPLDAAETKATPLTHTCCPHPTSPHPTLPVLRSEPFGATYFPKG